MPVDVDITPVMAVADVITPVGLGKISIREKSVKIYIYT
jgi:hypothetical protein